MPKITTYYAVRGLESGSAIYHTWDECELVVKGAKGLKYKKFSTETEAKAFCNEEQKNTPYTPLPKIQKRPPMEQTYNSAIMDVVYADGSSIGNGIPNATAGAGVFFGEKDPRNTAYKLPADEPQTNQRAEITAALIALQKSQDINKLLEIRTDSKYVINGATDWRFRWAANGFVTASGTPVLHADLWKRISKFLDARPGRVFWKHVKGHSGEPGNEAADQLAREGALSNAV